MSEPRPARLWGMLAEFNDAGALAEALRRTREEGYRRLDAYTPYPVEEVAEALEFRDRRVPLVVFVGGIVGGGLGYLLQYWIQAVDYPLNVGGRPFHSWPAFVPPTFELTILGASLSAFLGMLAMNGLPSPHHPLFAIESFDRATQDGFFLSIRANDRRFDRDATRSFLEGLGAKGVFDVPR